MKRSRPSSSSAAQVPDLRAAEGVPDSEWQKMFLAIDAGEGNNEVARQHRVLQQTLSYKYHEYLDPHEVAFLSSFVFAF